jgi:hypothetical protein
VVHYGPLWLHIDTLRLLRFAVVELCIGCVRHCSGLAGRDVHVSRSDRVGSISKESNNFIGCTSQPTYSH